MTIEKSYYIGVDVGTGSARACIIDQSGSILSVHTHPISKFSAQQNHFTQSSDEIFAAVTKCVRSVVLSLPEQDGIDTIKGIGFDATCSLVVIDKNTGSSIAVGPTGDEHIQDIVLWMDHRAECQTEEINKTKHSILKYVGGGMSSEMEIPKVKWLKQNLSASDFERAKFYDLPDFLTYKATGKDTNSWCSIVCKQAFDAQDKGFNQDFFDSIDLSEVPKKLVSDIENIKCAGQFVGYLSSATAKAFGLTTNCAVGSAVIDCYAGWIGTVAGKTELPLEKSQIENKLAAVAGTSTCHLVMSKNPIFVNGVWGPYKNILLEDRWLAEGGQSCTGELLHHVLTTHPAYPEAIKASARESLSIFEFLNNRLETLRVEAKAKSISLLAKYLFFYGDLHGNRSPLADSSMKGTLIGQSMNHDLDDLALKYYVAVEFIALQTHHIILKLNDSGHKITQIYLSGGQCRNPLLTQLMATATNMPIVIPHYIDAAVVLGSAMMGAKAAMPQEDLAQIMNRMSKPGSIVYPESRSSANATILTKKFKIFMDMVDTQKRYRSIMDELDV